MWYRARGIVEFRTNHRPRAREIFEDGVRHFPTSAWLNFGLGQEYEAQGRVDQMIACFQHVRLERVGSPTVLAMARYYYLWNRFELGQRAIQPIFDRYYELKIADDMFLYMRGLPMFDEAFGYRAAFARLAGKLDQARYELARARSDLNDADVERLERKAVAEPHEYERRAAYLAIDRIVARDVPIVYLFNAGYVYAYNTRLHGFAPNGFSPTWNAYNWSFE